MRVEFTGRHIDVTEPIRKFALDRLDRLPAVDEMIEVHFILTAEKHQRHIAEVNLKTRNGFHNCTDESTDMYTSIASALDKLEKQVLKSKKRHVDRRRHAVSPRVIAADSVTEIEPELAEQIPEVIRTDGAGVKPLSIDEAATRISGSGHGFLAFRNSKTDRLNVVYKRKDGNIGWIEPEQ